MGISKSVSMSILVVGALALGVIVSRITKEKPVTMDDFRRYWFCNNLLHLGSISGANGSPTPWRREELERYWINANKLAINALERIAKDVAPGTPASRQIKTEYDNVSDRAWTVFQQALRDGWTGTQLKKLESCVQEFR